MADIILPQDYKERRDSKVPASPHTPKLEDLTPEQQAAVRANAEKVDVQETYPRVSTAFTVIISLDGDVSVAPANGFTMDRGTSNEDLIGAIANLQTQIVTNISAQKTASIMMQQAAMMQDQMKNQQIQQMLSKRPK